MNTKTMTFLFCIIFAIVSAACVVSDARAINVATEDGAVEILSVTKANTLSCLSRVMRVDDSYIGKTVISYDSDGSRVERLICCNFFYCGIDRR